MTDKTPITVGCVACGHAWVALYLPMALPKAARAMASAHCPMCAASSADIRIRSTDTEAR